MYPQFLREAGYYCTNNSKEDYNLEKPGEKYHDDLMQCVHRHRTASPSVSWKNMPEAVAGDGFHPHAIGRLNRWYRAWSNSDPSV